MKFVMRILMCVLPLGLWGGAEPFYGRLKKELAEIVLPEQIEIMTKGQTCVILIDGEHAYEYKNGVIEWRFFPATPHVRRAVRQTAARVLGKRPYEIKFIEFMREAEKKRIRDAIAANKRKLFIRYGVIITAYAVFLLLFPAAAFFVLQRESRRRPIHAAWYLLVLVPVAGPAAVILMTLRRRQSIAA